MRKQDNIWSFSITTRTYFFGELNLCAELWYSERGKYKVIVIKLPHIQRRWRWYDARHITFSSIVDNLKIFASRLIKRLSSIRNSWQVDLVLLFFGSKRVNWACLWFIGDPNQRIMRQRSLAKTDRMEKSWGSKVCHHIGSKAVVEKQSFFLSAQMLFRSWTVNWEWSLADRWITWDPSADSTLSYIAK